MATQDSRAAEVVSFWLGDAANGPEAALARKNLWYRCGPEFDKQVIREFKTDVEAACAGLLSDWLENAVGALGLIILLDQFTRNVYRNSPLAYRGAELAWTAADRAVKKRLDEQLSVPGCIFLYHPFHHSESLNQQNRVIELLKMLRKRADPRWKDYVNSSIAGFGRHRSIVARFGRFPHRNEVLGRPSTDEEIAFLAKSPDAFGQGAKVKS